MMHPHVLDTLSAIILLVLSLVALQWSLLAAAGLFGAALGVVIMSVPTDDCL